MRVEGDLIRVSLPYFVSGVMGHNLWWDYEFLES